MALPAEHAPVPAAAVRVLRDPAGTLAPAEALARLRSGDATADGALNAGITGDTFWAAMRLSNAEPERRTVVLAHDYAPTDRVALYGAEGMRLAGDGVPRADSTYPRRLANFPLTFDAGESRTILVELRSSANMNFAFSLWSPAAYARSEGIILAAYGFLFGALALTLLWLLYGVVLYRDRTALAMAVYLAAWGAYIGFLNGLFTGCLAPLSTSVLYYAHIATIGLLFGSGALFFRRFLQLAAFYPRADKGLRVLQWASFLAPTLFFLGLPAILVSSVFLLLTGVAPVFNSLFAAWLWGRRHPFAGVFTVGWAVAHGSALLNTLRIAGHLPPADWIVHLPAVGIVIALPCFAWGVARRLRKEHRLAFSDALTGLANRHRFEAVLDQELLRADRHGHSLALLLVDADHFKAVNDVHGHAVGDRVLAELGRVIGRCARRTDCAARIGGEEFALLLIDADRDGAMQVAERLRRSVEAELQAPAVTVSVGVAAHAPGAGTLQALRERADLALYAAKDAGRNRVVDAAALAPA
ncbi:MAG TPA: hypothetical protein DD491_04220 [Halieaceae bacterium]|nr:hypothetical protein [Halieaceae bacterium]